LTQVTLEKQNLIAGRRQSRRIVVILTCGVTLIPSALTVGTGGRLVFS